MSLSSGVLSLDNGTVFLDYYSFGYRLVYDSLMMLWDILMGTIYISDVGLLGFWGTVTAPSLSVSSELSAIAAKNGTNGSVCREVPVWGEASFWELEESELCGDAAIYAYLLRIGAKFYSVNMHSSLPFSSYPSLKNRLVGCDESPGLDRPSESKLPSAWRALFFGWSGIESPRDILSL
jgi:hypothetical protein